MDNLNIIFHNIMGRGMGIGLVGVRVGEAVHPGPERGPGDQVQSRKRMVEQAIWSMISKLLPDRQAERIVSGHNNDGRWDAYMNNDAEFMECQERLGTEHLEKNETLHRIERDDQQSDEDEDISSGNTVSPTQSGHHMSRFDEESDNAADLFWLSQRRSQPIDEPDDYTVAEEDCTPPPAH